MVMKIIEIDFPIEESCQFFFLFFCFFNKAAINISKNLVQHDRTKDVELDKHYIKEKLDEWIINLPYVQFEDQLVY